ncbi:S53 family peptidase [Actinacidiphila yeochonensis]|uniref:S53 family peptidase n=1 Tax=Actinacidiphila yeochonensis TaxID=89050 RepID=UPI0005645E5F|nr:S53 family peptidase [Actinacidiphila yeochonensis]
MFGRLFPATAISAALAAVALFCAAPGATAAGLAAHPAQHEQHNQQPANLQDACPAASPGQVRCMALIRTDVHGGRGARGRAAHAAGAADALPTGYSPADIRSAYNLPSTGGAGQTVAVVEAYDSPTAEADLAVYRATYGLPACTTANGCFTKANQEGKRSGYPANDQYSGWSLETALDVDAVSAVCPACHILLVEADSNNDEDMAAAENTAARLGATEISNSYGDDEGWGMFAYESAYRHPGVAITAASGDLGFSVPKFPAVLPSVTAVGGTSLVRDPGTARGWSETAWGQSSSGCSAWYGKSDWQTGVPDCPGRVTADVSADADPDTGGLAVYDTTPDDFPYPGWVEAGGTSLSSPIVASVIALAGNPGDFSDASRLYSHTADLYDVTGGSNAAYGFDCGGDNLCNSARGYDGPTGLGTPNGLAAF